jgi:hypothetical protein
MSKTLALLADVELNDIRDHWQKVSPGTREGVIVFGALLLVTILVLLWAVFFRKSERHRRSRHQRDQVLPGLDKNRGAQKADSSAGGPARPPERRKERRRRRAHRPLNPTLAQTGGLPPIRGEDSSEPS